MNEIFVINFCKIFHGKKSLIRFQDGLAVFSSGKLYL